LSRFHVRKNTACGVSYFTNKFGHVSPVYLKREDTKTTHSRPYAQMSMACEQLFRITQM
jgi:hypothetical protein